MMNERIKELMGKTLDDKFSHTWDTMTHEGLLQFSEKFAQLIVRECKENFAKVWYEQGMDIRGAELDKFLTRFEEHFGVEE
jgi:hypothetical protein